MNRKTLNQIHRQLTGNGFLSLSLIGILVFYIIPFGAIIYYSMVKSPLDHSFVFFDNYKALLTNTAFKTAAVNTLTFSALAVPLSVILSLCLALMLESKIPGKSIFRTFFLSPMMVPVASIVLIWNVIFHYNGALNSLLVHFGIVKIDWMKSDLNQLVVVLLFLWKNLGYNMILFMAALNNLPKDLIEVAEIEGAGGFYKFFRIKLRYLSPTILFVTILSMINSFKVFREVYLLTGSYPFGKLYMLQHFMNNTFNSLDYQKLSAAAIVMCIVMIAIIAVLFVIENRFGKDVEG
jgi:multiple sugar transport system permease protein